MRVLRAVGAALVLVGLLLAVTSTASAQQTLPPLVTDYANYPDTPEAMLTDGCDATGVTGVMFSLNDGTPGDNLANLPEMQAGDTVTMTWTGVAPACVGSAISLVEKVATVPFFDPGVDQLSGDGGYNVGTLTDGPGTLSLTVADLTRFNLGCNYQLDAIVGVPLRNVGPSGSHFSASVRGDDRRTTVFSYRNSAYTVCVAQTSETTTTTTAPTTTTTAATTTTTAPPTSTTEAAAAPTAAQGVEAAQAARTTTAPTTTTTAPPTTTAAQGVLAAQASRTLAATGGNPATVVVGFAGVLLGLTLVAVSRRRQLNS
jgi:hypothetical protein